MKTIKIKLKVPLAGNDGRTWDLGQEVDWEEQDALRMIDRGYAERVHAPQRK